MFKKAVRTKSKLKLAITGPSGSGKTYSALRIAKGIGGKVAVIDTENGSASLYSDRFTFDTLELSPPYTTARYIEAMESAIKAGYDILIIDSISHQWAGEGGVLSRKEQLDSRGGNSFTNWGKLTPEQEKFKSQILFAPIHLITTMRSKQDYVLTENSKGKIEPKKVGMAPVQREGMEYEFTTVFDAAMNHEVQVSKDRTGLFVDQFFQITEKTGETLRAWLDSGEQISPKVDPLGKDSSPNKSVAKDQASVETSTTNSSVPESNMTSMTPSGITPSASTQAQDVKLLERSQRLKSLCEIHKWPADRVKKVLIEKFNVKSSTELTDESYAALEKLILMYSPEDQLV